MEIYYEVRSQNWKIQLGNEAKLIIPIENSSSDSEDFQGTIYIDKKWKNTLEAAEYEEKN